MANKGEAPPAYGGSPQPPQASYQQQGGYGPPQGAPYGGDPNQGYYQSNPNMGYYQQQGGPPPQGGYPGQQGGYPPPQGQYYPPQQGGYPPPQQRQEGGRDGCLGALLGALACCCCLDCLF